MARGGYLAKSRGNSAEMGGCVSGSAATPYAGAQAAGGGYPASRANAHKSRPARAERSEGTRVSRARSRER